MANVEKHTTSKNEYQNRSAFMSDHSKGYGVERHTRVTSLAENGRYISGRKNDDSAIKTGKTSAVTHVKRQAAEKFIGGKMQKAHYGESEPNAAASLTSAANIDKGSSQHYLQGGNNKGAESTQTAVKSEKAAELKRQLERKVAISEIGSKKETSKSDVKYIDKQETEKGKTDTKSDNRSAAGEKEKYQKYFSYKRTQTENKYKKKIYRVNKRMDKLNSGKSKLNNFTTLRKLAILKQDIVRPIKNGNAIGAAAVPAKIYLKKLLEKTKLGRFAVRSKEASGRIISAAKNAEDTSQAMYAAAKKASDEVVKGVGSSIERKVRKAHEKNKYLSLVKKAERAENRANKYLAKSIDKINKNEAAAASGNASAKLMKKVDNFSEKKNSAKKQQKAEARNKKLEKKIQGQYKRKNKIFKNKFKKKSKAKFFAAIGGSVLSFMPVLLIIILIVPIANIILFPFSYTSKDGKEEEIEDSEFPNTIQHYYEVMDEVVDEFNEEIDKFLRTTSEYDNTGVEDPAKKAQYDSDYADYQTQVEALEATYYDDSGEAMNNYIETYGWDFNPQAPEKDYWYTYEELASLGMKRGPIFEGFEWDDESDAARVPKGELYDEMLCTISTYNTKLMSRPETVITGNDENDTEAGEDSDVEDTPSSSGSGDIIFMNDENVAAVYGGSDFWEFKYWEEGVECPSGGDCCSITVQVAHYDEDGNFTGYTEEEEKYCPTHYVIMWGVWLDFDLDRIWESYNFDEEDEENYDEVKKEFDEEKKNAEKDGFSFSH